MESSKKGPVEMLNEQLGAVSSSSSSSDSTTSASGSGSGAANDTSPPPPPPPPPTLTIDTSHTHPTSNTNDAGESSSSTTFPPSTATPLFDRDARKPSTASALTDDTLIAPPTSPSKLPTSKAPSKGKSKIKSPISPPSHEFPSHESHTLLHPTDAITPHTHRHPGYGTIDPFDREATGPVRPFGTPREMAIALVRTQRENPRWAKELAALQDVRMWDEEAQIQFYFAYRNRYRMLYRYCPMLIRDAHEQRPSRPWELNRTNVSVVYAIYAMAMLWFYLYGPKVSHVFGLH